MFSSSVHFLNRSLKKSNTNSVMFEKNLCADGKKLHCCRKTYFTSHIPIVEAHWVFRPYLNSQTSNSDTSLDQQDP